MTTAPGWPCRSDTLWVWLAPWWPCRQGQSCKCDHAALCWASSRDAVGLWPSLLATGNDNPCCWSSMMSNPWQWLEETISNQVQSGGSVSLTTWAAWEQPNAPSLFWVWSNGLERTAVWLVGGSVWAWSHPDFHPPHKAPSLAWLWPCRRLISVLQPAPEACHAAARHRQQGGNVLGRAVRGHTRCRQGQDTQAAHTLWMYQGLALQWWLVLCKMAPVVPCHRHRQCQKWLKHPEKECWWWKPAKDGHL